MPHKARAVTGIAGEPLQGVDGISGLVWQAWWVGRNKKDRSAKRIPYLFL
jgi:hypothetical protein